MCSSNNNISPAENPVKPETSGKIAPFSIWMYILIVAIAAAAIAVTIFIGKRNQREAEHLVIEQFNQKQLILARSGAAGIENYIAGVDDGILVLSNFPVVQRMQPGMLELMELFYNVTPVQTSIRRFDKNGILRFIYPNEGWRKELIGQDYSQDTCYKKAKDTGEIFISGLITNEIGEGRIRFAKPLYIEDKTGAEEFNGVVMCSIDTKTIADLYISPIVSSGSGHAWLLNEDGIFLVHHEETFIGRDAFSVRKEKNPEPSYDAINRIQRLMIAGKEGVDRYLSVQRGENKEKIEILITYTPVRVFNKVWSLAVCTPFGEAQEIVRNIYRNDLYTLVIVIIVLSAAGVFFYISLYRWGRQLGREIEARKQTEEALRETHDYLEKLITYANAPIVVWDPELRIIRLNRAFEHLSGFTAGETIGQKLGMLFPETSMDESLSKIAHTVSGEQWESVEIPVLRKDGDTRIVLWNSANIYTEDGKTLLATIAQGQDITERKRSEEALKDYSRRLGEMVEERTKELRDAQEQLVRREKLAILGQLAGGVSHELRNPLGVISNAVFYLKNTHPGAGEKTKEYLQIISSEVGKADKIVTDLLDFSRARSVEREETAIHDLVADVLIKQAIPENIEVTVAIPSGLPPVFVDPVQMDQVFVNLIINACQAMLEGGRLTISALEEKGRVNFSVADTGCGISEENMAKLFEPLFTTKSRGIGLGLAVSRNLAEANGGHIKVESEEGKGSTFIVTLPIRGEEL